VIRTIASFQIISLIPGASLGKRSKLTKGAIDFGDMMDVVPVRDGISVAMMLCEISGRLVVALWLMKRRGCLAPDFSFDNLACSWVAPL
jgi:hypothetical protein